MDNTKLDINQIFEIIKVDFSELFDFTEGDNFNVIVTDLFIDEQEIDFIHGWIEQRFVYLDSYFEEKAITQDFLDKGGVDNHYDVGSENKLKRVEINLPLGRG